MQLFLVTANNRVRFERSIGINYSFFATIKICLLLFFFFFTTQCSKQWIRKYKNWIESFRLVREEFSRSVLFNFLVCVIVKVNFIDRIG